MPRIVVVALLAALSGCTTGSPPDLEADDPMAPPPPDRPPPDDRRPPDGDDPMRPPPADPRPAWSLAIDTSSIDPYVTGFPATAPLGGVVRASYGVAALSVDGTSLPVGEDGSFAASLPVEPGLRHVVIEARDAADVPHVRRGDRSLLVADFHPEGELNPQALLVTLDGEMLAALSDSLRGARPAAVDLAHGITGSGEVGEGLCTLRPTWAWHERPMTELAVEGEALALRISIPDLHIEFEGECGSFFTGWLLFGGELRTGVAVRTTLTAPAADHCVTALGHTPPEVALVGFDLDLWGSAATLFEAIIALIVEEIAEDAAEREMAAGIGPMVDALLAGALTEVRTFEATERLGVLDVPVELQSCLTGLEARDGRLLARIGLGALGPGGRVAPGAPLLPGEVPATTARRALLLDSQLVSQLLFSAWRSGAFEREAMLEVPAGRLAGVAPRLADLVPPGAALTASIDATLPPVVRTSRDGELGDLQVELGDLEVRLEHGGRTLFRLGSVVRIAVELAPRLDGTLRPVVVGADADAWLVEEAVEADGAGLAALVAARIEEEAGAFLDEGALALPGAVGSLRPLAVAPAAGGRYVELVLE